MVGLKKYTELALLNKEILSLNQELLSIKESLLIKNEQLLKEIEERKMLEKKNEDMLIHAGRLALLGEMATGVAHELNQPLSIIRTNMQTLEFMGKEDLSFTELKEIIVSCIKQTDRAAHIVSHMRDFARVNQTHNMPINLYVPLDEAIAMFNEQFRLHEIALTRDYGDDIPFLSCSSQEMEQLIVNLLS
ncbi:MAG: hypothetical protein HKM04_05735, partial [Legionellales bacterium]|nr:hypothetical protein [Legionellales bacterium]